MSRRVRFWKAVRDGVFALLGLAALGLAAFAWLYVPQERTVRLRMTAGRSEGERYRVAEELRREAARRSIVFELREAAGSDEALREVDAGRLDVALAQGGLDLGDRPNLRQVATLHVEPLHLLVKQEYSADAAEHLSALRGKVIGLGERGSGTNCLATEVLDFAGLRPGGGSSPAGFLPSTRGYADLRRETDRDGLPDAVFMVSTLPSPVARHLITAHGFRMVPLPFFEAFSLGALDQPPEPARRPGEPAARVKRRHVYAATVPAFTYGVEPGVPPRTIPTLGTRLLLIAHKDVPPGAVRRLLEVVFNSPFAQVMQPPLDAKLLDLPPELTWHDGTAAYLRRNTPLITGDLVDLVEKELSIVGALAGSAFFLGQWVRRRYRRRRDRGFESYILRVNDVERQGMALERAATLDLGCLLRLQEELGRLKSEALENYADGVLEGEELMSGFLTHVSDTRDYLARLILHERDNLEEQVRRDGREPRAVWREAVGGPEPCGEADRPAAPVA